MNEPISTALSLHLRYIDRVNYAVQLNGYPVCESFELTNGGETDLVDVDISLTGEMIEDAHAHLDLLPAATTIKVDNIAIKPDNASLLAITEGVATAFNVTVSQGDTVLLEEKHDLQLLPMEQWPGAKVMPELLSAYVTPNADAVTSVLTVAAKHLEDMTGDASLDGYQTQDANRARAQVAAVYQALREQNLIYSSPPAGFELNGQRVRLAQQVVDQKLATCLDTSLLMASCFEACGLHALIVLISGHAMVGAWLTNDHSVNAASDDAAYLLKRCAEGVDEMVLVESTMVTHSEKVTFEQAVAKAMDPLRDPDTTLHCFIDVRACRLQGIKPVPLDREASANAGIRHRAASDDVREVKMVDMTGLPTRQDITRQQIWERKLLDFSLRNNLLNMKLGRRVIQFMSFGIDRLEDSLSNGTDFEVIPVPTEEMKHTGSTVLDTMCLREQVQETVLDALSHRRVISYLDEMSLNDNLKFIYRTSRTAMEENGSNSLFLALGVLRWYESDRSQLARYAPILMMPMQIVRHENNQYVIRSRDEETIINVSLLEMVRQQFKLELPLLDPLPEDEHGVDVNYILSIVRQCVKDMPRWNVMDECVLGLFSFNKFVMWKDIRNGSEQIKQHPFIAGLLSNCAVVQDEVAQVPPADLDASYAPTQLALPVDVDSSQLEAVIESDLGRSFILHGPPGTGKSQTITNIIANALYHGKRVLFVAAKMAALEVVQMRLGNVGLAPFCLEMHSNKSTKTHFLGQLKRALDVTRYTEPATYQSTAEDLRHQRNTLNAYIKELHQRHSNGFSLYDCIEGYLSKDVDKTVPLPADTVERITSATLGTLAADVTRLDTVIQLVGNPAEHELRGLSMKADAVKRLPELEQRLRDLADAIKRFLDDAGHMHDLLAVDVPRNLKGVKAFGKVIAQLMNLKEITPEALGAADDREHENRIRALIDAGQRRDSVADAVTGRYSKAVLQLDEEELKMQWDSIQSQWWLKRFFQKRRFVKGMRFYNPAFAIDDLPLLVDHIATFKVNDGAVRAGQQDLLDVFGYLAQPGAEKWEEMKARLDDGRRFHDAIVGFCRETAASVAQLMPQVKEKVRDAGHMEMSGHSHRFQTIVDNVSRLQELLNALSAMVDIHLGDTDDLREKLSDIGRWIPAVVPLGGQWYHWCANEDALRQQGLGVIVDEVMAGASGKAAAHILEKSAFKAMADNMIRMSLDLQVFSGVIFEDTIDRFRALDKEFQQLTKKELYCRLAANVPAGSASVSHGSEVGIVKRNIANNGRGTSIRGIIDQIPTLLPKLCPCMLMSPLSVAQFLAMDNPPFDLVIFDEASQLPTSEAVGTIARGKTVIVVGDPKQMPPTNFFNVTQVDEEEADIDDLDSILDDAIALSLPSRYLTWHYRSKHESLIAFSNSQYYDGRLYTFPSVDDRVSRVKFVPVNGTYDMGHSRCNDMEATAIVNELVRRLNEGKHSVGVVAFSIAQQNLIEDKLMEAFERQPSLEAKAYDVSEPVFIKNLENVQGDERDVILFSVGYGPDSRGRVSMNFGPLNKTGGERRLNVAVSRARYEMMVFSTLMPEHIDLDRSKAKGVAGLRQFLEYARDGRLSVDTNQLQPAQPVLANSIAGVLAGHGYKVKSNVGRSRFKVDVAVVDPRDESRYLLGIVCDGRNYQEATTARDREVCRPMMLTALGWHIARVWSVDWYRDRDKVVEKLLAELHTIEQQALETGDAGVERHVEVKSSVADATLPGVAPVKSGKNRRRKSSADNIFDASEVIHNVSDDVWMPYPSTSYPSSPKHGGFLFQYSDNRQLLLTQIDDIITREQPVNISLVSERIRVIWGIGDDEDVRFVRKRVAHLLKESHYYVDPMSLIDNPTYWRDEEAAAKFGNTIRKGGGRRNIDIPLVEVVNAILVFVAQEVSIPLDDLQKQFTKFFELPRRTPKFNAVINLALEVLIRDKRIVAEGNTYRLP